MLSHYEVAFFLIKIFSMLYSFLYYTKCNYKIGEICEVIFYQDDEKK
jgi:hypothetical protein